MTQYQIAIIALLIAQIVSLYLLCDARDERNQWKAMWTRDTTELLHLKRRETLNRGHLHAMTAYQAHELAQWKRYGILRDPKTGRYVKKDRR
jgi:hypothetical protein